MRILRPVNSVLTLLLLVSGLSIFAPALSASTPIPVNHIRIHYHRSDGIYMGWTVYAFGGTTEDQHNFGGGPVQVAGTDGFGAYFDVGIVTGTTDVGIIVHNGNAKDPGPDEHVNPSTQGNEFYQLSGVVGLTQTMPNTGNQYNPNVPAGYARIHFFRPDATYTNWTVYAFNDTTPAVQNNYNGGPVLQTGTDAYGAYYDVPLGTTPPDLGFIVHNIATKMKSTPADLHLNVSIYNEAWIVSGDPTVYLTQPTTQQLLNGNFLKLQAFWIDRSTVLVQSVYFQSGAKYLLISDKSASLTLTANGVTGGVSIPLTPTGGSLTDLQKARFPQLAAGYSVLTLPESLQPATYLDLLEGQLAVSIVRSDGSLHYATGVQDAGVLDDLYAYSGALGPVFYNEFKDYEWGDFDKEQDGKIRVKVWAPTAQSMNLQLFHAAADKTPAKIMAMNEYNGLWVATLPESWTGKYYLLDERVYAPNTRSIVENFVTDPYSVDLAINGTKSRLSNLESDAMKPRGWDEDRSPELARINDLSIYELHVRDFSVGDATVPAAHRGTYLAFTDVNSDGMKHLRKLEDAGLRAIHLLPTFHFNSINEDKSTWLTTPDLSGYPSDGQQQQAAVTGIQSKDAYNWGYDPNHYLAPEGGYATNPDNRVIEYRKMVMGLHRAGLRVIQDVVFNHTSGFGEASNSILDEVVPDYYNRLDMDGVLQTASCCADTATEHLMMGKLQQDAVLWNAEQYKIDGFRFDIMSFTFVSNLEAIKTVLAKLTPEHDGIDGRKIYIYGEGFTFGETANSALGVNAQQSNLYGTGLGSFNDRIRDGIRGGGPFDDPRVQGFATGELTDPSVYTISNTSTTAQRTDLLHRSDWIRVGLTGNLRDYTFTDSTGATTTGGKLDYQGQATGYTASPIEAVNYISAHDNQILFDAMQLKSSEQDTVATRARRQVLGMSLVELSQGIPFLVAGDDLLRSKDMDQNSYDSGDWFNKIDWTGFGNNWGIGLPITSQNQAQWQFEQPLLANGALRPTQAEILGTTEAFQEFLRIRNSSPLFRLSTAAEIEQQLHFLNTGPSQTPGLIVMELDAAKGGHGEYRHIVTVFNATNQEQAFTSTALAGFELKLHPVLKRSADPVVRNSTFDEQKGVITVPALTTAVFVSK
jgi:pullulanase